MSPQARAQGFTEGDAVHAWSASGNAWVPAVVAQVISPADGTPGSPPPFAVGSVRLRYCGSAKEKWVEPHMFGTHLARSVPTPSSLPSNSTPQAGAIGFEIGEAVRVWSAPDAAWVDAVVSEVAAPSAAAAPAGGQHPAGSIRVAYSGGAKERWVRAEQLGSSVQRVLSTPVGRLAPGSAVSVWSNSENAWMDAVISEMVLGDTNPSLVLSAGAATLKSLEVTAVKVTYAGGTKMKLIHARDFPSWLRRVDLQAHPSLCVSGQLLDGAGLVGPQQQVDEPAPAQQGAEERDEGQALPAPWHHMRKKLPIPSISSRCMEQVNRMVTCQHAHGGGSTQNSGCQRASPLRCPNGQHPMIARVSTEVLNLAHFRAVTCSRCRSPICVKEDARYWCKKCDISYCLHCAGAVRREQGSDVAPDEQGPGGLPDIMPGDILYCGPDPMSIYHTVLACSPLQPADPEITELIFETAPPGAKVLQCYTIESTRSLAGAVTPWYSAISFLQWERGPGGGSTTKLVASMAVESDEEEDLVEVLEEPVPVKVLFHPLRGGGPSSLDARTFREAVLWGASTASVYGKRSAIRAFLCSSPVLEPGDFPDAPSRAALLKELHARWEQKPICASVCIKVWQMYFELVGRSAGHQDEAVAQILRWMPVYSDVTLPSELLRALTLRGWEFRHL